MWEILRKVKGVYEEKEKNSNREERKKEEQRKAKRINSK